MHWLDLESYDEYDGRTVEEGRCPTCGCNEIRYGNQKFSSDGRYAYTEWVCPDCETVGEEWYELHFIRHAIHIDDDGV
jgi:hypothetical protein